MQTKLRATHVEYWNACHTSHLATIYCPRDYFIMNLFYVSHWCLYQLYHYVVRTYYLLFCRIKTLYELWASFYYDAINMICYYYHYVGRSSNTPICVGNFIDINTTLMINDNTLLFDDIMHKYLSHQCRIASISRWHFK